MLKSLTAAALLATLCAVAATSSLAVTDAPATARAKAAAKKSAKKPSAEAPAATNDSLDPGQLSMADRVLTGVADCEFKQKVTVEKIAGHNGNFRLLFDKRTYIMVPEETTTGAIRLVDTGGAVVWVQIPRKSMLMNQKEHHRIVDDCQADEQRIATQAAAAAGASTSLMAGAGATTASTTAASAAAAIAAGSGLRVSADAPAVVTIGEKTVTETPTATVTTEVTATTTTLVPPSPPRRGATAPSAAASGTFQ